MKRSVTRSILRLALAVLAVATAAACGHSIGDDCRSSVDCDPNGNRACDLSQPGGYCTIQGCDETSCPSGSTCVRYFPELFLTKPCDPQCEDLACQSGASDGGPDAGANMSLPACPAACPQGAEHACAADELCLDDGVCARRNLEQRACAKSCDNNSDCRDSYQCRLAGTRGSMVLSRTPGVTAHFCAPSF